MKFVSQNSALLLALALTGCAGTLRPAVVAAPASAMFGDYQFSGRVSGVRVGGSIRLDSTGGATLFSRGASPVPVLCDVQMSTTGGHLTLACGTVELRLAVANAVVAPEGTVSFDGTKSARRQFDPFACTMDRDLSCGALGQETSSAVVRRYTGKVAVLRIVAE